MKEKQDEVLRHYNAIKASKAYCQNRDCGTCPKLGKCGDGKVIIERSR